MTYANITNVSTRLGRPISTAEEIAQVNAWLADVGALILSRIPTLDALVTAGSPSTAVVSMVEANAVIRKIRNPEGKHNEKIDDYSYGLTPNAARGDLFLTDEEWDLLTPNSATGAFTVRPYGLAGTLDGTWVTPTTWVPSP